MNYRRPVFNFLLGTAAGAVLATVPLMEHFANRAQREVAAHDETLRQFSDYVQTTHAAIDERDHTIAQAQAELKQCAAAGQLAAQEQHARDFRDSWYTLVYEPGAAADNAAPLELLNLVRPGLGTLLAKMQAQQPAGAHLRYVLRGYVEPAVQPPDGVHFVRTLDPSIATQQAVQ